MRFLLVLCIAFTILLQIEAQSHGVAWGARIFRDRLLIRKLIDIPAKVFRIQRTEYIFEQKDVSYPAKITQIILTDRKHDGRGGYASLISGGPHQSFANIQFKSQRGRGIHFIVDIYGL